MSNRSFIDRAAEERRQGLVVGRVVFFGICQIVSLELVEHGVHGLIGIGSLALPRHRVEIIHVGLVGLLIVAKHAHRTSRKERVYSTTFGTRKKWFSVAGALATISSAISPSSTTSARFFITIGITEVIGSTPSTSTSESCSTKARIALSSPARCGTSSSSTAIRAKCAIRRTVAASTDIIYGLNSQDLRVRYSRGRFCAATGACPVRPWQNCADRSESGRLP